MVPLRFFVAQPFAVSGTSMVPTFAPNDYLVIDRLAYASATPKRGDVVVFRYPLDPSVFFIKRIVGLPNEIVMVKDGVVSIGTKKGSDSYVLAEPYVTLPSVPTQQSLTVLEGDEYFVLGDNRGASFDSLVWGPLPARHVIGRAAVRIFPFTNLAWLPGAHSFDK